MRCCFKINTQNLAIFVMLEIKTEKFKVHIYEVLNAVKMNRRH